MSTVPSNLIPTRLTQLPAYIGGDTSGTTYYVLNGVSYQVQLSNIFPPGVGTVTSVAASGGSTGLTFSGSPITTSGTLTLAGTLASDHGGTGQTTYANGQLLVGNASGGLTKATITAGPGITVTNGDGSIQIAASGGAGTVTSVAASGGTTGLSFTGSPVTTTGTFTLTGTLGAANGGTGLTALGTGVATALGVNVGSAGAPVLFNGAGGTPASLTLTNANGLPIGTGVSGLGTGIATFLAAPTSVNLAAAMTNETGTGSLVFATSPSLVTPDLGTPSAATLTNATGLPVSTGVSGLGSGVATMLATFSSANIAAACTNETGTGALVFGTSPTLATPSISTPAISDPKVTQTLNAQTGTTYTLVLTDVGKLVTQSNASAITTTIPPNSSVAVAVGQSVDFAQIGAGQVTFAPGVGVTLRSTPGLKMRAQYSGATAYKIATDEWLIVGDLAA